MGIRVQVGGAVYLIAATWACGSVSDASLPVDLDPQGNEGELPRAQAVLSLQVSEATGGAECAVDLSMALPDATASETLTGTSGNGRRLVNGASARGQVADVKCRVAPSDGATGYFDVRLSIRAGRGGTFEAAGNLRQAPSQLLAVQVAGPGLVLEQENCEAEVDTILPGAVWLRAIRCSDLSSETQGTPSAISECEATGAAIFESCAD